MSTELHKDLALIEETQTAARLIELGIGEFQNLDAANDFYFLPLQLLSSGFERLMKCLFCLLYCEKNGGFPNQKRLRKFGHSLSMIKSKLVDNFFVTKDIPALEDDLQWLRTDHQLNLVVELLEKFGDGSRYHNLDVVSGADGRSIDVKQEWEEYEQAYYIDDEDFLRRLVDLETQAEAFHQINRESVIIFERLVRAVARQFVHSDSAKAQMASVAVHDFLTISDEKLGTRDYRKGTTSYSSNTKKPHRRGAQDLLRSLICTDVKSKRMSRATFEGEWPFTDDEVIIECRYGQWCTVTINGFDYALNGLAAGRYNLPFPDDAGRAVPGISLSRFTDLALKLGEAK